MYNYMMYIYIYIVYILYLYLLIMVALWICPKTKYATPNQSKLQVYPLVNCHSNGKCSIYTLVGGWATPLKNMKVNWDDENPNIWENKKWQPNHQPVHVWLAMMYCFFQK